MISFVLLFVVLLFCWYIFFFFFFFEKNLKFEIENLKKQLFELKMELRCDHALAFYAQCKTITSKRLEPR